MGKAAEGGRHWPGASGPRVLHVVPALFGSDGGLFGGAERYAFELARHMAEQVPTKLLTFGERSREFCTSRLRVRVIGAPWYVRGQRLNPISGSVLPEILGADIVHCHQRYVLVSSLAAVACRLTGRRVFVTDLGGGGWDVSAFVSTTDWFHGHLHISEYSRQIAKQAVDPRAHVILGGVDTELFSPGNGEPRDSTVLFVGRLLAHKGIDQLIQALPSGMSLEIIGRPHDARYLGDLHRLAHGKAVTFRHDCTDAELIASYRRARCLVLPSVYRTMYGSTTTVPELLGQTLLEAMATGTPTICTNVASMPEIVMDGVTGFVVPPGNPSALRERLEWLRDHPAAAEDMGAAARALVLERFTWPQVVRRCLDLYGGAPERSEARARLTI